MKTHRPEYTISGYYFVNPEDMNDHFYKLLAEASSGGRHIYEYKVNPRGRVEVLYGSDEDKQFIQDSWASWVARSKQNAQANRENKNYTSKKSYNKTLKGNTKVKAEGGRRRKTRRRL